MELKKNPSKDLRRYYGLFLNIGLVTTLAFTTLAFEWKSYEKGDLVDLGKVDDSFEELIDIPITEQPPPPPPQKVVQVVEIPDEEIIEEEIEIDLDVEVTEETEIEEIIVSDAPVEEEVEEIFTIVEQNPTPEVGYDAYYRYIVKNLRYPPVARKLGLEGKVFVQFIIDKQGNLLEPRVIKGISADIDEEAIRVIKNGPKWTPGKQRGRPVKVRMIMPITFQLS